VHLGVHVYSYSTCVFIQHMCIHTHALTRDDKGHAGETIILASIVSNLFVTHVLVGHFCLLLLVVCVYLESGAVVSLYVRAYVGAVVWWVGT